MINRIVMVARVVNQPELQKTPQGTSVAKFRVAYNRPFSKKETTDFFTVEAWRGTAEFVAKHFAKGKLIGIDGFLQSKPWEDKNGSKHQGVFILAEHVYFVGAKAVDSDGGTDTNKPNLPNKSTKSSATFVPTIIEGDFHDISDEDDLPF